MNGNDSQPDRSETCRALRAQLQAYVDGDLERGRSLEIFLHARDCAGCGAELERLKSLFARLDALPEIPVPAGFDARILAAVPYQAYREMEPIRRERVPVFLEETFLPAPVRSAVTRAAGVGASLALGVGLAAGVLPDALGLALPLGLLPEALVRIQRLARRLRLRGERSESG